MAYHWALVRGAATEFYWDRNGRWTGSEQFVEAITSTVEISSCTNGLTTVVRVEHRYDDSTWWEAEFFKNGDPSRGRRPWARAASAFAGSPCQLRLTVSGVLRGIALLPRAVVDQYTQPNA